MLRLLILRNLCELFLLLQHRNLTLEWRDRPFLPQISGTSLHHHDWHICEGLFGQGDLWHAAG